MWRLNIIPTKMRSLLTAKGIFNSFLLPIIPFFSVITIPSHPRSNSWHKHQERLCRTTPVSYFTFHGKILKLLSHFPSSLAGNSELNGDSRLSTKNSGSSLISLCFEYWKTFLFLMVITTTSVVASASSHKIVVGGGNDGGSSGSGRFTGDDTNKRNLPSTVKYEDDIYPSKEMIGKISKVHRDHYDGDAYSRNQVVNIYSTNVYGFPPYSSLPSSVPTLHHSAGSAGSVGGGVTRYGKSDSDIEISDGATFQTSFPELRFQKVIENYKNSNGNRNGGGSGNRRNRRSRHSNENVYGLNVNEKIISSINTSGDISLSTVESIKNPRSETTNEDDGTNFGGAVSNNLGSTILINNMNDNWRNDGGINKISKLVKKIDTRLYHEQWKNKSHVDIKLEHDDKTGNSADAGSDATGSEDNIMFLDGPTSQMVVSSYFSLLEYDTTEFTHYNVGVLLVSGTGSSFDLEKCSPAVDMALDIVNQVYLRPHKIFLHKIQKSYPTCDNSLTPGLAADMRFLSNVISFIGPACGFALEPVARLSAYWNIPVVTGLGDQPPSTESEVSGDKLLGGLNKKLKVNHTGVFGDKTEFSTLTRLSYCQCRLKLVFDAICKRFKWEHLAIVYDKTDLFSFTVGRILINGLKDSDYEVYGYDIDGNDLLDMDEALTEITPHARIVILSLQESLVREFMLKAHARGLTKGEWAFLDVELFKSKPSETNVWSKGDDKTDFMAREAYQALLTISLLMPRSSTWSNFSQSVKDRALRDYNFTFPDDEEVNFFIGAFYDGVILLGMALNETLTANESLQDGQQITLRMWNRTFEGVTGNVTIDENGDRDADYSILDMNPDTGKFEVVAHYLSQEGLRFVPNREIRWPGRKGPPADIPVCGFLGNEAACQKDQPVGVIPVVGGVILVFALSIMAVIVFVYRHLREVEAASSTKWRILPDEISFETNESKAKGPIEEKESSRGSLSLGTVGQATFVQTATHRGVQVGLRKIALTKRIEFTKQIVSDIRQVRDLQHENIARLVGLCLSSSDPKSTSEKWDQILILTEYCSRGSLRDVLLNVHIHLDWPFRLSLISDIASGMSFLHSNVGPHGRLSSSKCLVDARFVVKISDFGLHTLRSYQQKESAKDVDYFIKLLWVAPEHLPRPGNLERYSLKGDIYSFGIILYEVAYRALPYSVNNSLTPEEIVEKVASLSVPSYRPEITEDCGPLEIRQLMQNCWLDCADDRPDFGLIRTILKKMMKGAGTVSLVDDLLRRLEQHATHLEVLVEDKTRELEQEKRRSEDLLYQVLPRQVAEQLLRGETVSPESFDAVTVYFSDIVGFTSICLRSSPIQVVDFLNNLYGTFDGILDSFDAYKVETIGDAYLCVSGAPQRNGDLHATEIAYLALAVLDAVTKYEIGHLPEEQLKIRIGIHTGPICAGVVGHRMPHYCLFGDTVNTASRMESSGLPLRIHITEKTAEGLESAGGFHLVPRGEVLLKGKGVTNTFWLMGCDDEFKWKRARKLQAANSKESIDTKCSTTLNHHYSHSPSNNIMTICVTPAE